METGVIHHIQDTLLGDSQTVFLTHPMVFIDTSLYVDGKGTRGVPFTYLLLKLYYQIWPTYEILLLGDSGLGGFLTRTMVCSITPLSVD